MRSTPSLRIIVLVLLLTSVLCAGSWQEFQIAGGPNQDGRYPDLFSPDVCGTTVVWYARVSDQPRTVWAADISDINSPEIFSVAQEDIGKYLTVNVSENYIVWRQYYQHGAMGSIMAMNLKDEARPIFRIGPPENNGMFADIDANSVVWIEFDFDSPEGSLIKYARLHGNEVGESHTIAAMEFFPDYKPAHISGDLVVWGPALIRAFDGGVHGANIGDPSAPVYFKVGTDVACGEFAWYPRISGKWAAWYSNRSLYADNLFDPYPPVLITEGDRERGVGSVPQYAIADNIIIWTDDRYGSRALYGYNLATHTEFRITDNPFYGDSPAICANKETGDFTVVWVDAREGWYYSDIFGMLLDGPLVAKTPAWE